MGDNSSPQMVNDAYQLSPVVGIIAQGIEDIISFFDWLFGGGGSPPIPRQLLHQRHPLYPVILGISDGLIPTEASEGKPELCGDAEYCGTPVLPIRRT